MLINKILHRGKWVFMLSQMKRVKRLVPDHSASHCTHRSGEEEANHFLVDVIQVNLEQKQTRAHRRVSSIWHVSQKWGSRGLAPILTVHILAAQSCLTLWGSMDCSPPGSSVRGILQATALEWVAMSFSADLPRIEPESVLPPALMGGFFTTSTTWETPFWL